MIAFDKDKAYMEVLHAFRRFIDTEYKDGGWLPSVRVMSERFGVSTGTYTKAINCLITESMAKSYPRKGIYITPKKYRPKKVGLVIGNGSESPFLIEGTAFAAIIEELNKLGYDGHLIQGSPVANVPRSAVVHCVSGLVWFAPASSSFSTLREMVKNKLMPLIAVAPHSPRSDEDLLPLEVPTVSEDFEAMGRMIVENFIERGHKIVGNFENPWFVKYSGLNKVFPGTCYNISAEQCFSVPGLIQQTILEHGITGLLIGGSEAYLDIFFKELLSLPPDKQPEVIVKNHRYNPANSNVPYQKIISISDIDTPQYSREAVRILIRNLDFPEKIKSLKVKTYYHQFYHSGGKNKRVKQIAQV